MNRGLGFRVGMFCFWGNIPNFLGFRGSGLLGFRISRLGLRGSRFQVLRVSWFEPVESCDLKAPCRVRTYPTWRFMVLIRQF